MHGQRPTTITDAEVLSVTNGVDEATAQPVVVLTLRPITGSGWGCVHYLLHPDNACSLLDRLNRALNPAEYNGRVEGVSLS